MPYGPISFPAFIKKAFVHIHEVYSFSIKTGSVALFLTLIMRETLPRAIEIVPKSKEPSEAVSKFAPNGNLSPTDDELVRPNQKRRPTAKTKPATEIIVNLLFFEFMIKIDNKKPFCRAGETLRQ